MVFVETRPAARRPCKYAQTDTAVYVLVRCAETVQSPRDGGRKGERVVEEDRAGRGQRATHWRRRGRCGAGSGGPSRSISRDSDLASCSRSCLRLPSPVRRLPPIAHPAAHMQMRRRNTISMTVCTARKFGGRAAFAFAPTSIG